MPGFGYDFAPRVLVPDYSEATRQRYCAEEFPGNPGCALPPPSQRNRAAFGNGFADSTTARLNLFFSRTVVSAIEALTEAAKVLSEGNMLTISYYGYHYELAGSRLPGSGHLALQRLLESPHLDAVASPYMYQASKLAHALASVVLPAFGFAFGVEKFSLFVDAVVRNNSRGMLLPHGPWDSATANGKWWVVEDDSRTALDPLPGNFKFAMTGEESADLLRRNALTALWHGHGLYFYDLNNQGYFGQPSRANVTAKIWEGVSSSIRAFHDEIRNANASRPPAADHNPLGVSARAGDMSGGSNAMVPEIAVFSDEASAARRVMIPAGEMPLGSNPAYGAFDSMLLSDALPVIAGAGAAVRAFQLSDLLLPGLEWKHFRLCVFLNAFVVPPNISAAIKAKLQRPNTTLLWQYAPGLYSSADGEPDPARVSELLGIRLHRGEGGIDLLTRLVPSDAALRSFNSLAKRGLEYGHRGCCQQWPKQVDPWFYWTRNAGRRGMIPDSDVEVLGVLERANRSAAGLVRAHHRDTGHYTIFSAAPGLPVALWRALAQAAGVHLFTADRADAPECIAAHAETWLQGLTDSVELHGSSLLYHAAATCGAGSARRSVLLPGAATVTDEAGREICSGCTSFQTPPMAAGEVGLFRIR